MNPICDIRDKNLICNPEKTNRLCYANLSDFASFVDSQGCACNSFYGWVGQNCDEFTFSTYFTVIGLGTVAGLSLFYFVLSTRLLILSWKYEEPWTSKFWTLIFSVLGSFGNIFWALSHTLSAITTSGTAIILSPEKYGDFFFGRWNALTFMALFAYFCTFMAVISVAIVWLDTSNTTRQLNEDQKSSYIVNRRILVTMGVVQALLIVFVLSFERFDDSVSSITGFGFALPTIWLTTWFTLAYARFMPILKTASTFNGNRMIESTKNIVHITTRRIVCGLILYFIADFGFSCMDTIGGNWKSYSAVGKVGGVKVIHHLAPLSILVLIFGVYRYLLVLSTNGGMYMIIGICNPSMVENPEYFKNLQQDHVPAQDVEASHDLYNELTFSQHDHDMRKSKEVSEKVKETSIGQFDF